MLLGLAVIPPLPRWAVVRLAGVLARLAGRFARRERRIAMANLELAFGDGLDETDRARVLDESFRTFALVLLDVFWFTWFTRRRIRRYVLKGETAHYLLDVRPVVSCTAHLGNWEVMGLAVSLYDEPLQSVAVPLDNPIVDRWLNAIRRRTGQRIAERRGAVRAMMRALKQGGRVGLLMDQNTLPSEGGEFVPFFGVPVPVSKAASTLAERCGTGIVCAYCLPDARGVYTISALPPFGPDDPEVTAHGGATQELTRRIERLVRENPGKWLWSYKRWKFIPEGEARERYPYYARPVESEGAVR